MDSKTWWIIIIILVIAVIAYFVVVSMTGNSVWGWQYCDSVNPCPAGVGDCDKNSDCLTGYCASDVGIKYGKKQKIDVCEVRP